MAQELGRRIQGKGLILVLTCLTQYDITDVPQEHLTTLLYGLFRPTISNYVDKRRDEIMTRELFSQLAFQLRKLRRRAVTPILVSPATF